MYLHKKQEKNASVYHPFDRNVVRFETCQYHYWKGFYFLCGTQGLWVFVAIRQSLKC